MHLDGLRKTPQLHQRPLDEEHFVGEQALFLRGQPQEAVQRQVVPHLERVTLLLVPGQLVQEPLLLVPGQLVTLPLEQQMLELEGQPVAQPPGWRV